MAWSKDTRTSEQSAGKKLARRRRRRTVLLAAGALLFVGVTVFGCVVSWRISLARAGAAAIGEPTPIEDVRGSDGAGAATGAGAEAGTASEASPDSGSRILADAAYSSIVAEEGHEATVSFTWDDDWFFGDATAYNHELARASAVLSAVANSESAHYQAGSNVPDYMESLLAQLGFENASTASYEYRSEIIDQLSAVFEPNGTDVTAYTIASKHITNSTTGQKKLLVVVAVRGSYGTEWLSNLQMSISSGIVEGVSFGRGDHTGFSEASMELSSAIYSYLEGLGQDDLGDVSLLLCGHSRGGATANLTAAYLDQVSSNFEGLLATEEGQNADAQGLDLPNTYIHRDSVYCYAFATPGVTDNEDCRGELYDNIFNLLNPADLVPRMPLASWGFSRYGHDLWLPEFGTDGFDATFSEVKERFRQIVGCDTQSDPSDVEDVDQIVLDLGQVAPTPADFGTPLGVVKSLGALTNGHNLVRIIHSHAPDLYIAWTMAIDEAQLRSTR